MDHSKIVEKEQLAELFRRVFRQHSAKLDLLVDLERQENTTSISRDRERDRLMGLALRTFSRHGPRVEINEAIVDELKEDGVSADEITAVGATMTEMRQARLHEPSMSRLREHLKDMGIVETSANIARTRPFYLRGLAEALIAGDGRYEVDASPFDKLLAELKQDKDPGRDRPEVASVDPPQANTDENRVDLDCAGQTPATEEPDISIVEMGEKLVAKKPHRDEPAWDDTTARQARSVYGLLSRYVSEKFGYETIVPLTQSHLASFEEFLRVLSPNYGKSPADHSRSIADLRRTGEAIPKRERGLSGATRNRHLTNLDALFEFARAQGFEVNEKLNTTALRARRTKSARSEREKPMAEALQPVFQSPIFTGCAGWEAPHLSGEKVYHRAIYFGTLFATYMGVRREEYCGLEVDDITSSIGGHACVRIRENRIRRIKNAHSERILAIHPEILRLGFLEYVQAIKNLGYVYLFPDLYSPTTASPLGDRFYDELRPVLRQNELTLHQLRHYFNNTLKQLGVSEEVRGDIMGHSGKSETSGLYAEAAHIQLQLEKITLLPNLTEHLEPRSIALLPWVVARERAPFSRRG